MGCGSSTEAVTPIDIKKAGTANGTARQRNLEEVEPIELTEGVVQEYIRLEQEIYQLEKKNVLKKYEAKMAYADEFKKTVDQLEATYKELKKMTEKEKADVDNIEQPSVRAFLKQQGSYETKYNKEQQEYLEALNKQEVAEKELKGAKQQYERAARVSEIYKQRADKINALYDRQDRMLAGIFGGDYGSDLENKLEGELDDGSEWQQRVSLAKFKWTNGRVLLVHACTQMAFGVTRWKELENIEPSNTRMRYFAAAEARNNFIAAGQNVQSCRVYLGKVKFPYCTEEEMANMEQTVNSAFTDIQTNANLGKAMDVYQYTHKKVAALIQWFDQVINETIMRDLETANETVARLQKELREERLTLFKDKVRERFGTEMDFEYEDVIDEEEDDEELLALEAERVRDQDDLPGESLSRLLNLSQPDGRSPTPLPTNQLAPLPTKNALFGDVSQKMNEYQQQKNQLTKRQDAQRGKQEIELQEKLSKLRQQKQRRNRSERKMSMMPPSS